MIRVTRAKRAAKSTALDSPAEDAADTDIVGKSPAIKSKKKSKKEEDSDMEEEKEVEEKKSKRKGRKKTSSSKRKSRSSKVYDNHTSEEASSEDMPTEITKSKSDRYKHKQHKNQKQEKQEQQPQEPDVQEKPDLVPKIVDKNLDIKSPKNNVPDRNSQEKQLQEEQEINVKDKKEQERNDENRKSIKLDDKIEKSQDHNTTEGDGPVEKEYTRDSQEKNIIEDLQKEITHKDVQVEKKPEQVTQAKDETENATNKDVGPKQVSNTLTANSSQQNVLPDKVSKIDPEVDKVEENNISKQQDEQMSKQEYSEQKTTEEAVIDKDASKNEIREKVTKSDSQEKKRRDYKKSTSTSQENSIDNSKENNTESPLEKKYENKVNDSNDENTLNKSDVVSSQEESVENGPSTPFVINRRRKWGSRPTKITTQKSLTISTDVLKDIIPDVKPVEFDEVVEHKKHDDRHKRESEKIHKPILPKIIIDNTVRTENVKREESADSHTEAQPLFNRKVSIVKDNDIIMKPLSPPRNKSSSILYITNLVRPFTLPQLKNLLQRTGKIVEDGFWIDRIKSKCYVKYETEDQAVETRHALHGVTWPISNPKALQVDFSTEDSFDKAKISEENPATPVSTIPGTVEDWLREQDLKRAKDELEKPWQRKAAVREWDVGKGEREEKEHPRREDKPDRRRHRTPDHHSPEPVKKFKKKEEEAPAKLLDDLFKKTKSTPCIYWLPLSSETIAVKEEQRRVHMLEHERRLQEIRRQRRH